MSFFENILKARPEIVQHDFQPIYYFSRCTGLWPFTVTYNSNGSIKAARVHQFDSLWFFVAICLYLIAVFYYFDRMMTDTDNTNHAFLSNQMYFMSQMAFHLFTAVGIVLDFYNRKKLVSILDKFIIFDKEVCFLLPFLKHIVNLKKSNSVCVHSYRLTAEQKPLTEQTSFSN